MSIITNQLRTYDNFSVVDSNNIPVTGLINTDFIIKLYNPNLNEVSSSCFLTILEIGFGIYQISFIPNLIGNWVLLLSHLTYFPNGKIANYNCIDSSLDDLNLIKGLVQHNYRLFNASYITIGDIVKLESATVKLYNTSSDCENDINSFKTYTLHMAYDSEGKLTDYQSREE